MELALSARRRGRDSGDARARPRSNSEFQEVLLQVLNEVRLVRVVEEHAAELLAGTQNLAPARPTPSRIRRRKVEQLQRTVESGLESISSSLGMRTERALDITPDISQLFGNGERVPTAACQ